MSKKTNFLIPSSIFVFILMVFFVFYNSFLLDSSIERIHLALKDVSEAKSLFESDTAPFLLQDLLVSEIGQPNLNLERLVASQAFQSAFTSPGSRAGHKKDAEFLLQNLLSSYEQTRSPIFKWLDRFNQFLKNRYYDLVRFMDYLFVKSGIKQESKEALEDEQVEILRRARELELGWQFQNAAEAYQLFLERYPDYSNLTLVKIYLTSVYIRSHRYSEAESLLSEINLTLASPNEIQLISSLKKKLNDAKDLTKKRDLLISEIEQLRKGSRELHSSNVVERLREAQIGETGEDITSKLFQLGLYYLYLFDLPMAQKTFKEVLEINPPDEISKQATWIQGWIYLLENNFEESRRLMRELFERYPEDRYGRLSSFALATIAQKTGNYEEAAKEFERLSKMADDPEVSFLFKYRAGGVYLYDLQDIGKARQTYSEAKQLITSPFLSNLFESGVIPSIQENLRDAAFERFFQGDFVAAKKFFEDTLKVNPNDAWGYCGYGLALYVEGEKKQGIDYVTRCRSLKKDEYTLSSYAFIMENEENLDQAMNFYREALKINGDYLVALYNLGRLELSSNQFEEALKYFTKAKERSGKFHQFMPSISNNLGLVKWRLGDMRAARLEFLSALDINPHFSDAHSNLAQLYQVTGKPDLAKKHLKFAKVKQEGR